MAEDQTQQTRVLVINGQTIIVQGGGENNSLNEINTDLIQQALQEVSASSGTVVDDSTAYITSDTHVEDESSNNNIVGLAILQGEQGDTTTIQLTAEQAEALGLNFTNGDHIIKEHAGNVTGENMLITDASGGHHLIYTDSSLKDDHGFVFDASTSNTEACTKIVSVENDHENHDSVGAQTGTESLSVLSNPVTAFLGGTSNQPLSLIPQIVNGQVTYTVKIHEDGEKVITSDHLEGNSGFINDSTPVSTITTSSFQHSESDNIASYVSTSVPSLSYGSSVATPVSIQTLSMGEYQTQNVEPGSILTDSQTNISYVILPTTSTSDEPVVVSKPSIPVQQVPSFVPFSSVTSSKSISSGDAQGAGISEVYSTVTAVDTSSETVTQVSSPAPKSVMGIPIASVGSDAEPVVSGTLSSVTASLAGGLIRVVPSSDRSLLQPNSSSAKFTSILSPTGRLIPSVPPVSKMVPISAASSKPATINCAAPKITVTYPRSFSGVTKVPSTLTMTSSSQSLPVMSTPKIIVSQGVGSGASILPASSTSVSGTSTSEASVVQTSSSGITKSSSVLTSASTVKPLSSMLASKVASSSSNISPRIITVSSQSRTSLAPKIVTSTSGSKVVAVNPAGPKIITVNASSGVKTSSDSVSSVVSATLSKMPPAKTNSSKPLGSSENPIQLVQHGQTFHSMQSLSESQLRQIATVLQQQNLDATSSKNVLYDAETKTRIIYRVVYPEDLDIGDPGSPSDTRPSRGRGRRGRPPKSGWRAPGRGYDSRSVDLDLDEDRLLDDSNKGERKKHLPRTRSGRLSRPPRHMVKDYKRLHHLDFADADLDDSDGGYSDYQMSDHEEEEEKPEVKELLPGLVVPKRKISSHFRCPTCQKIYLGHSRMARHFEAFPDHGSIEQIQVPPARTEPKPTDIGTVNGLMRPGPGRRRGKRRGPWAYLSPEVRSQRRKIKLKEMLGTYTAEELVEVCGPVVAGLLPMWELLLLRVDSVRTDETYLAALLEEVQALLERLQAVARDVLRPVDEPASRRLHQLELEDKTICALLDVPCGLYAVDDTCLRTRDQHVSFEGEPYEKRSKLMEDDDEDASEVDEKQIRSRKELNRETRVSTFSLDTQLSEKDKNQDEESAAAKKDNVKEDGEFLLQSPHVDDVDVAGESDELPDSINTSSQSFSDPEQHTKALQTVDEIVNESLKNLEFSVDDMVHPPQRNTPHQNEKGEKDAASKFSVSSFDPEIALAAMGEGSRTSCGLETLDNVADSKNLYCSQDRGKVGVNAGKGHGSFISSSQMNSIVGNVKFKKGPALTSGMEEEQITSFSANMPGRATTHKSTTHHDVDDDQNLHSRSQNGKHDGFTNHLHHVSNNEGAIESYDPEIALRAMGEGDQPVSPSKVDHLEYSPSVKMDVNEGEGTPTYVLTGIVEDNEDDSEATQEHFSFHQDNEDGASVDFNPELALNNNISSCGAAPTSKADKESAGSFISEMTLVTGKSDSKSVMNHEPVTYAQQQNSAGESQPMFGPEEALASMGDGNQEDKPTTFQSHVNPLNTRPFQSNIGSLNSRQFQLQCGSEPDFMEVSLDESGPELDFEALSEEFNQNTRHS